MKQTHGGAAILSFFIPGLGQLVQGRFFKGLLYFVGVIVTLPTLIGAFIIWVLCVKDAYNG